MNKIQKLIMKLLCNKKIVAIFLGLSLCFSSVTAVYAQTPYANAVYSVSLDIVSYPSGVLTSNNNSETGHSFLVVRNYNSYSIRVGHMSVPAGGTVTVSVFGNRSAHQGVWYNIEGCYSSGINSSNAIRLTTVLTESKLATLNNYINNYDYYDLFDNNCALFSVRCWNAVSDVDLTGTIPIDLWYSIYGTYDFNTNTSVPSKTIYDVAYQTSNSIEYDESGA